MNRQFSMTPHALLAPGSPRTNAPPSVHSQSASAVRTGGQSLTGGRFANPLGAHKNGPAGTSDAENNRGIATVRYLHGTKSAIASCGRSSGGQHETSVLYAHRKPSAVLGFPATYVRASGASFRAHHSKNSQCTRAKRDARRAQPQHVGPPKAQRQRSAASGGSSSGSCSSSRNTAWRRRVRVRARARASPHEQPM